MADLEALQKQRQTAKANVTRIKNLVSQTMSPAELECRLGLVEAYFKQILTLQTEIEILNPKDVARADLEDLGITTKAKIIELLGENYKRSNADSSYVFPVGNISKLPNLELPRFEGKYSDYKNFMSSFKQLVDNDSSLSNIEKFNHLLHCLSGQALDTIRPFQVTNDNYKKALDRLKQRYDKRTLIFLEHISDLYDLPEIQKPSSMQLRKVVDSATATFSSLKSLGKDEDISHALLIHLIAKKLDNDTQLKWKEKLDFDSLPSWDSFCTYLERRCQYLESTEIHASSTTSSGSSGNRRQPLRHSSVKSSFFTHQRSCSLCKGTDHSLSSCTQFKSMVVDARYNTVKKLGLCLNCLAEGHGVAKCSSKYRCKTCKKLHHSLLHRLLPATDNIDYSATTSQCPSGQIVQHPQASVHAHIQHSSDKVILATAVLLIRDGSGEFKLGRALLDSCSQVNLITETFANVLNLQKTKTLVDILGVGGSSSKIKYKTETKIRSRHNELELDTSLFITNRLSGYQPESKLDINSWTLPSNLPLADECFFQSQPIDILLGAESFFDILRPGQIKIGLDLPTLQETKFGWVVSGRYKTISNSRPSHSSLSTTLEKYDNLNLQLEHLWSLEKVDLSRECFNPEQQECESLYASNVSTDPNGRIMVMLPLKEDPSVLGYSQELVRRRFLSLERRLARDPMLKAQYIQFMREYQDLGHMTKINEIDTNQPHYIIPHHCVLKPNSTSTKLRVVFDASAGTTSGKSLNDILLVGPTIQDELFIQLLRFRLKRYALTGDIVKMYRMVLIHPSQRRFQLILWRESENQPIQTFELNTITYGMASSPFLAIRSLHFLADKYKHSFEIGAKTLKTNFYVDDLLSGADDLEELQQIKQETTLLLSQGGFELAKITSNHPAFESENITCKNMNINEPAVTSALGITWDPKLDVFLFSFQPKKQHTMVTKRSILSLVSTIFDPIGLVCPIIIRPRVLLQDLWINKIDWDTSVSPSTRRSFQDFIEDLNNLNLVKIPRYVLHKHPFSVQLHGFSDASIRAYGCCIYARVVYQESIYTNLITAKCRVAPTKKRTLPQLELCGAHLLSKTFKRVLPLFANSNPEAYLWTDSTVVLRWLQLHSSTLTTFVGNRISEMQEDSSTCIWRHVPTKDNPADIVSRGCTVEELVKSIWLTGPEFLRKEFADWPQTSQFVFNEAQVESAIRKTVFQCELDDNSILSLINRTSSYTKLLKVLGFILRFTRYAKAKPVSNSLSLTPDELRHSLHCAIWNIQQKYFAAEIHLISDAMEIKTSLKFLGLFIEEIDGFPLVRVGGRLKNADIPYDQKHPFLLPKDCNFVDIMIRYMHISNYHAGPKALQAFIRQHFWVIGARSVSRKIVRSCVSCIRYRPKLLQQVMGNLPLERVTPARPFQRCGVDFCGPFNTYLKIRGKQPYKCYVAIFICFSCKAVHIEPVTDLSSDAFIAALKRLIGRRGLPTDIFCDNATNFVGANSQLVDLKNAFLDETYRHNIVDFCSINFINFHFIPPRAPHFGGIWEAAVKSAKGHLYRSVTNAKLTFEELTTALIEIEAIMNSRPMSPLSTDPNDFEALTPGHFLIGGPMNAIPEPSIDYNDISHLQRWKRITAIKQQFWKTWSSEYLNEMLQRHRWTKTQTNIQQGALVLIYEDNLPPQRWATGRVVATMAGNDGKIRVADVKTTKGTFRRPIRKLALLLDS